MTAGRRRMTRPLARVLLAVAALVAASWLLRFVPSGPLLAAVGAALVYVAGPFGQVIEDPPRWISQLGEQVLTLLLYAAAAMLLARLFGRGRGLRELARSVGLRRARLAHLVLAALAAAPMVAYGQWVRHAAPVGDLITSIAPWDAFPLLLLGSYLSAVTSELLLRGFLVGELRCAGLGPGQTVLGLLAVQVLLGTIFQFVFGQAAPPAVLALALGWSALQTWAYLRTGTVLVPAILALGGDEAASAIALLDAGPLLELGIPALLLVVGGLITILGLERARRRWPPVTSGSSAVTT